METKVESTIKGYIGLGFRVWKEWVRKWELQK